MILGVTGGIASGKSTVVALLADLGAQVVSADQLSRDLVEPGAASPGGPDHRGLGKTILNPDGTLDRKGLGALVFADSEARA